MGGRLVSFAIFSFLLFWWIVLIALWIYYKFYRGKIGPITRKGEIEEHVAKMEVLDKHKLAPNEKNRKYKWFGLVSYLEDELNIDDFEEDDDFETP